MKYRYSIKIGVDSLKDASAIEELVNELGLNFDIEVCSEYSAPAKRPNSTGRRHYQLTPEIVRKIKRVAKDNPGVSIREVRKLAGIPHSPTTVGRVLSGSRG